MSGSSGFSATKKLPETDGPFACSSGEQGTAVPGGAAVKGKATNDASGSLAGVPPEKTASGEEGAVAVNADSLDACGNSRRNHILTFEQLPQRVKDCQVCRP